MSEVCKEQELECRALGNLGIAMDGGDGFSGSVLVSRVVLCVITCTERSSIHSHSRCEHKWSLSSYTITATVSKLPVMCLDKLSLEKSLYVKTKEWTHCLILQSHVRRPVNDIPEENVFREAVERICCYCFKSFFLNALKNKRKGEEVPLSYALSQRVKWEMCVGSKAQWEEGQRLFSIFINICLHAVPTVTQHGCKRLWIEKLIKWFFLERCIFSIVSFPTQGRREKHWLKFLISLLLTWSCMLA